MNNIFDYTLLSIFRHGFKNVLIITIYAFLVWLLSSVILITNSLNQEYKIISEEFPDILIQKYYGGRTHFIDEPSIESFWQIPAVSSVQPRIWGEYYFERDKFYLSIFGIENFEEYYNKNITKAAQTFPNTPNGPYMIASKSVYELLNRYIKMYKSVPVFTPDGELVSLKKGGEFDAGSSLENNDVILVKQDIARKILGIPKGYYTDVLLRVSNPNEIDFIADKIRITDQTLKVTTKDEMLKKYQFFYDYKSGWFLMLLITSFVAFAIILYDKASGLRSEEKKELGILKALGWEISHIINYKLTEALILSVFAFLIGIILAIFYVYILNAPGLKYMFTGYCELKQPFELIFVFDFKMIALLFFATVPLYVSVCIIPSWKIATVDAGEIMR